MSTIKSKIISKFDGWSGDTIFELQNGQVWKQDQYQYKYFYLYNPTVVIEAAGIRGTMTVKNNSVKVKRLV